MVTDESPCWKNGPLLKEKDSWIQLCEKSFFNIKMQYCSKWFNTIILWLRDINIDGLDINIESQNMDGIVINININLDKYSKWPLFGKRLDISFENYDCIKYFFYTV